MIDPTMYAVTKDDTLVSLMSIEGDTKYAEEIIITLRKNGYEVFQPKVSVESWDQ